MAKLHIALQAGFVNDTVSIDVDGQEVFSQSGVTNRNHFGPAETIDLNIPAGRTQVTVYVPTRQASAVIPVDLGEGPLYIGVLLTPDDDVTYQIAFEPFRYF
jgi:hypothetical protein